MRRNRSQRIEEPKHPIDKAEFAEIQHYLKVNTKPRREAVQLAAMIFDRNITTIYRIAGCKTFAEYKYRTKIRYQRQDAIADEQARDSKRNRRPQIIATVLFLIAWWVMVYMYRKTFGGSL